MDNGLYTLRNKFHWLPKVELEGSPNDQMIRWSEWIKGPDLDDDKCKCQYLPVRCKAPNIASGGFWPLCMTPDFWTLSIVQDSKYKRMQPFGNWIYFCPHLSGGRHLLCGVPLKELISITGKLRLALRDPTDWMSSSPHLKMETDPVSKKLCSLVFRILDNEQSAEPQSFWRYLTIQYE
jgi:hypothetical protein